MPKTEHITHSPNSPIIRFPNYPVFKIELGEFGHL